MGKKTSPSGYITIDLGEIEFDGSECAINSLPETDDIKVLKEYVDDIKSGNKNGMFRKFPKPLLLSFLDVTNMCSISAFGIFQGSDDGSFNIRFLDLPNEVRYFLTADDSGIYIYRYTE